ncbi:NAD-P-binding protein [Lactarius hengduanensis]|nr:NAD-P-binding protein [Lactarius hengduanensis]
MADILVIGATGFCGRHAARYVLEHPERSKYTVGLAARSRSKIASIGLPIDDTVQIFELDILDKQAVEAVVKQAKVVLNCIGPFWHYGTPIVHACARNGVHYVDITGETPWIFDIISKFDYLATQTRAIIIPSCAVDSIPADAGVYLASQTLGHAPLGASTTASRMGGGAPGGTIATFIATAEDVPRPLLARSARDWALSPVPGADSPPLRLVYSLGSRRGAVAPFGAINRALVQRTAGLLELARLERKRATEEPPPGYGPAFTYTEFMQTGGAVSAFLVSVTIAAVFVGITFITPFRWLVKRFATQPGSGPADDTLERGGLTFVNITASDEPSPRYAKSVIKGHGDPGTLLTAAMVGESAIALLLDELPPLAKGGGVLTPVTALGDNIIRRMKACERFEITSGIVDGPDGDIEESRKTR